jgi:hypothetical protein
MASQAHTERVSPAGQARSAVWPFLAPTVRTQALKKEAVTRSRARKLPISLGKHRLRMNSREEINITSITLPAAAGGGRRLRNLVFTSQKGPIRMIRARCAIFLGAIGARQGVEAEDKLACKALVFRNRGNNARDSRKFETTLVRQETLATARANRSRHSDRRAPLCQAYSRRPGIARNAICANRNAPKGGALSSAPRSDSR